MEWWISAIAFGLLLAGWFHLMRRWFGSWQRRRKDRYEVFEHVRHEAPTVEVETVPDTFSDMEIQAEVARRAVKSGKVVVANRTDEGMVTFQELG